MAHNRNSDFFTTSTSQSLLSSYLHGLVEWLHRALTSFKLKRMSAMVPCNKSVEVRLVDKPKGTTLHDAASPSLVASTLLSSMHSSSPSSIPAIAAPFHLRGEPVQLVELGHKLLALRPVLILHRSVLFSRSSTTTIIASALLPSKY